MFRVTWANRIITDNFQKLIPISSHPSLCYNRTPLAREISSHRKPSSCHKRNFNFHSGRSVVQMSLPFLHEGFHIERYLLYQFSNHLTSRLMHASHSMNTALCFHEHCLESSTSLLLHLKRSNRKKLLLPPRRISCSLAHPIQNLGLPLKPFSFPFPFPIQKPYIFMFPYY